MASTSLATRIFAGFIAGALAVLIFHQGMYVLMQTFGLPLRGAPYRMTPSPLWPELFGLFKMAAVSVPGIVHQSIWGGLWGILFAFLIDRMPGGPAIVKGFLFGMIFPMLIGSWLLVPLVKGGTMFAGAFAKDGFNVLALRNGFLLNGVAFGIGLGILYPLLSRRKR
jgi:hypothetical protein